MLGSANHRILWDLFTGLWGKSRIEGNFTEVTGREGQASAYPGEFLSNSVQKLFKWIMFICASDAN